jgi:hypothetical protein
MVAINGGNLRTWLCRRALHCGILGGSGVLRLLQAVKSYYDVVAASDVAHRLTVDVAAANRLAHNVFLRESLPVWQLDLADPQGRPSPRNFDYTLYINAVRHQLGGNPPRRSVGKITDAVLALIMGGIIAIMGTESRTTTPLSIAARLR